MKDPVWLTKAKALPAGRSTRVQCCAADRSMLVTNDKRGYRGYCFRCDAKPWVSHGLFSVEQLQRRKQELSLLQDRAVSLPRDFTTDIPTDEAIWLYKAGVGTALAKHYGFGYSAALRRVVLPVYRDGALIGFTARSTINERPKYIEKMASASSGIFLADPSLIVPSARGWAETSGPSLVLTEDILSAVRVGRCVRRCVSLMGTSAHSEQIANALQGVPQDGRIAVWLDGDKAGRNGAASIHRTLALMGFRVHTVHSPKDPKRYSNKEIQRWLTI